MNNDTQFSLYAFKIIIIVTNIDHSGPGIPQQLLLYVKVLYVTFILLVVVIMFMQRKVKKIRSTDVNSHPSSNKVKFDENRLANAFLTHNNYRACCDV